MSRPEGLLRPLAALRRSSLWRRAGKALAEAPMRALLHLALPVAPPARGYDPGELASRTDELNQAAERYFADFDRPEYLLGKPFSDHVELPRYLFNVGVLTHWLRLRPGDVVAELGAGSAWVSHFLNLAGCRTLAIDVSPTALGLGRQLFEADPRTRWDLEPGFLPYDGHRLPLADECCDRFVLHDAFHHLPNPGQLLAEMSRVLIDGGIVAMSEPGRHHSAAPGSRREVEETGVLENDVVIEELAAEARRFGFTRTTVVPLTLAGTGEVPADDYLAFLRGRGMQDHWLHQARELLSHHFILLYKGEYRPTTRRPARLRAEIDPGAAKTTALRAAAGEPATLSVRLVNLGDTVWLAHPDDERGWTRLGVHLHHAGDGELVDFDWHRAELPADVPAGGRCELEVTLPPLVEQGDYRLVLDLVAEHVTWFAEVGSSPVEIGLTVS